MMLLCTGLSFSRIQKYSILFIIVFLMVAGIMIFKNQLYDSVNSICFTFVPVWLRLLCGFSNSHFSWKKVSYIYPNLIYLFILLVVTLTVSFIINKRLFNLEDKRIAILLMPIIIGTFSVNIFSMQLEMNIQNIIIVLFIFLSIIIVVLFISNQYYKRKERALNLQYYQELENNYNDIREFRLG